MTGMHADMAPALNAINLRIILLQDQLTRILRHRRHRELRRIIQAMHAHAISPQEVNAPFLASLPPRRPPLMVLPRSRRPVPPQVPASRNRPDLERARPRAALAGGGGTLGLTA